MPSDRSPVLGFDTSAAQCAAALVSGGRVLARKQETMARGQAERLLPMLEEVLAEAGSAWRDLAALAVCTGPGNFTGLRLSVAAARGLALSLGIPAIGITRFEALSAGVAGPALVTVAAPQGRLYAQSMRDGAPAAAPFLAEAADLGAAPGTVFLGDGAEALAARSGGTALGSDSIPDPGVIATLAAGRIGRDTERPVPLYMRPADAAPSSDLPPRLLEEPAG